jgi:hypothetical protein
MWNCRMIRWRSLHFKGTVSRDWFFVSGFFMNRLPTSPFRNFIFSKLVEIFACQGAPRRYQRHWWQIMGTISDSLHIKKNLSLCELQYPKESKQSIWNFSDWKIFSICHRCQRQPWCILSCECLRKFSKKIRNGPIGILRGLGETDSWKNLKSKISWHCPLTSSLLKVLYCPKTKPVFVNLFRSPGNDS